MVGQFPPHVGGVGVHIHSLSKKLVEEGHEVYVITYPHKDLKDIDGIHVIGTKGLNLPGIRGLSFKRSAKKQLDNLCKKENIDIIHGHYLYPAGAVATEIGKKHGINTYITAHGSDMFELYKNQSFMRNPIKKTLKDADKVFAVSNALNDEILATGVTGIADKTSIYWNSVDVNKFKEPISKDYKDKPTVMFVGNVIKRKNVSLILDAKKECKTDFELVIVGDGPLLNDLKRKVKDENIEDVVFTGAKRDVENIIPTADLLILPSFSESFGLVLIEALACGVPVIGSNVGGIKEIITPDVGLLIDPENPSSLSKAIDDVLSNEKLYNKFKSNARKRALDFSEVKIPYEELQ